MFSGMPVDWLSWSFGAGLSFIFLWLISVPPMRAHVDDAMTDGVTSSSQAHLKQTCHRVTRRVGRIE
jgi:hypothetical protein